MENVKLHLLIFALAFGVGASRAHADPTPSPSPEQTANNSAFTELFSQAFSKWDVNHDGRVDLKEITAALEDPKVHGIESAIAVMFHGRMQKNEKEKLDAAFKDAKTNKDAKQQRSAQQAEDERTTEGLTRAQALALANETKAEKELFKKALHIESINHELFAPGDPKMESFHQGGMGDCYLLCVVGAYVHRDPQAVRKMIQPQADGTFQVHFGDGQTVTVKPLTDAELIMGAKEGSTYGVWLSVLEKAYAHIAAEVKEKKTGEVVNADSEVTAHLIGRGGNSGPVIKLLTGHDIISPPLDVWAKQDPAGGLEKAHQLLVKITSEHRLMAMGTHGDVTLPKGIPHGHALSVFGYDKERRVVLVFNPWGNSLKPADPPGLVNGYPTTHGTFEVPLAEFVQIFWYFNCESKKPMPAG
jgi:hypothetical protein